MKPAELKAGQLIKFSAWWRGGQQVTAEVINVEPYKGYGKHKHGVGTKTVIHTTLGPYVVDYDKQVTLA